MSRLTASLWQLVYVITSELLCQSLFNNSYKLLLTSLMDHPVELPLDQGLSVSTPSSISEVALWFSVPFSATKIILSREHSIVNIFYIFYIFQIIHTFSPFRSLKSTTDITNFFDFNSPYGNGFPLSEIPDQDFSFCYISTSNGNCDKISFCISIPGYTSINFNPFGVNRNTHLSVTYSTFCPFEIARFAEKLTLFTLLTNFGTEPSFSIVTTSFFCVTPSIIHFK